MRRCLLLIFVATLYNCSPTPSYEPIDGILEVPENRDKANSRTLKLVYKVLKAKDTSALKAPIVFLQGGPGGSTLIMEKFWANHSLRENRDIVLMDQRGTGASEASCIDIGDALITIIERDLDYEEELQALDSIFQKCKLELEQKGVDLAGYNSRENAADFEDLRKALGYDQLNLFGASYGTRLGLTIMRDFPNSVRSATFIGVFPPESQLFGELIGNFENSLFEVLLRCEQDEECTSRYPNLKERLVKVLEKLKLEPLRFDYKSKSFVLNQRDALLLLHQSLYSRYSIESIPKIIDALEKRESEPISNAMQRVEFIYNLVNWPMNNSVMAYEELPFLDSLEVNKALKKSELGFDIATFEGFASLSNWHPYRASDFENQPVISEIPTLMVSGSLDPVTPPSNAIGTLKNIENGYNIIFPDESHELFNPCFFQIYKDFLANPFQKPDLECTNTPNPLQWN